jgi:putative redox protein
MSETYSGTPIMVRHDGGTRFIASVRDHEIVTDQMEHHGGANTGPTPLEALGAALGSCIALYVQQFCETRELPYAGMKIEVRQKNEKNPNRVGKFAVTLVMPEQIPEQYAAMLERVVQSCPVHNTLVEGAEMTVDILVPAGHAS